MLREDLGMEPAVGLERSRFPSAGGEAPAQDDEGRDHDPSRRSLDHRLGIEAARAGLDVIVASSWERRFLEGPAAEIPVVDLSAR